MIIAVKAPETYLAFVGGEHVSVDLDGKGLIGRL